jgi:hypothetical protein
LTDEPRAARRWPAAARADTAAESLLKRLARLHIADREFLDRRRREA